jgi:cytoskeletal protein RodZ
VTPGNELRTARERLNLSRDEISFRTKIHVRKITALEEDAFDQLPAGIYLDGIAAAYAREVGLDAEPLIQRLRTHVAPPPPETLERIAAARRSSEHQPCEVSLSLGHSMLAFAAVAVVLAIAGIGVRLYPGLFATEPQEATFARAQARQEPAVRPNIDFQVREERGTAGSEAVAEPAAPPPAAEPAPPEAVGREREAPPVIADEKAIPSPAAASPPAQPTLAPTLSGLTGVWTLETEVQSSSLRAFDGLRLGYRLALRQNGDRIEGTGQKVTENGVALSGARRTAITVYGTLDEGRMRLTFGEQGARRRTTGTFDLMVDENGVLRGVFASEAARTAGAVAGRRL